MMQFNEANVNTYLQNISNNQPEIESFANDMENDFLNCFQQRFIMTQQDIDSLTNWPQAAKDNITQITRVSANLHAIYNQDPINWSVSGFELPGSEQPALPDTVTIEGGAKTTTDTSTGKTFIEVWLKAVVHIC